MAFVSPICLRCRFSKGAIVQDYVADGKWQKDWSTESEARNILNKLGITEHMSLWNSFPVAEEACRTGQNSGKPF